MKKQKQLYVSPETETLVVRFEGRILAGSVNASSSAMPSFTEDEEEDW